MNTSRKQASLLTLTITLFAGVFIANAESRTWTSKDGRKLEAELLEYKAEQKVVRIKRADGNEFSLPLDKLSEKDVAYLKALQAAKQKLQAEEKQKAGQTISLASEGEHKMPYHVYYPKSYEGSKKLPLLILFSPGGHGKGIMKNFHKAADELRWILVGCDRLKNNMDGPDDEMFGEMLPHIEKSVVHNPERLYMGGMSGGAMRAYGYSATVDRPWKGIVACGGWLGGAKYYDREYRKNMTIAIVNGDKDEGANCYTEPDTAALKKRRCKVKTFSFPGGHAVGPPETLLEAMQWMESEYEE